MAREGRGDAGRRPSGLGARITGPVPSDVITDPAISTLPEIFDRVTLAKHLAGTRAKALILIPNESNRALAAKQLLEVWDNPALYRGGRVEPCLD